MNPKRGTSCCKFVFAIALAIVVCQPAAARKITGNNRELKQGRVDGPRSYEIQLHQTALENRFDFQQMRALGVSRVIVRVFQDEARNGGLFFSNPYFRVIRPMLDSLSSEFQAHPVQLSAWMITRNYKWLKKEDFFDYAFRDGVRYLVPRLDLFNPDAVNRMLAVFQTLAMKPIDAILIQDDFFIRHNEGFSSWGKASFQQTSGLAADPQQMVKTDGTMHRMWRDIKTDRVVTVLKQLVAAVKTVNPTIDIGMNIHYETPFYPERARAWYAHDLQRIAGAGIDSVYLMAYHRQIKEEMNLSEQKNRELFAAIVQSAADTCSSALVVKLQIRDWRTGIRLAAAEMESYLQLIPASVTRVCFTPVTPADMPFIGNLVAADRMRQSTSGGGREKPQ